MDLGEFRELTKNMTDEVELIFSARSNPFGNVWSVSSLEATSITSFGIESPALKLAEEDPSWAKEDSDLSLFINPRSGQWATEVKDVEATVGSGDEEDAKKYRDLMKSLGNMPTTHPPIWDSRDISQ